MRIALSDLLLYVQTIQSFSKTYETSQDIFPKIPQFFQRSFFVPKVIFPFFFRRSSRRVTTVPSQTIPRKTTAPALVFSSLKEAPNLSSINFPKNLLEIYLQIWIERSMGIERKKIGEKGFEISSNSTNKFLNKKVSFRSCI